MTERITKLYELVMKDDIRTQTGFFVWECPLDNIENVEIMELIGFIYRYGQWVYNLVLCLQMSAILYDQTETIWLSCSL